MCWRRWCELINYKKRHVQCWSRSWDDVSLANGTVHYKVHTYTVHFSLCPNDNEQVYDVYNIIEKQCK